MERGVKIGERKLDYPEGADSIYVLERKVNDFMPVRLYNLTAAALEGIGKKVEGSKIAMLGWALINDSDDARNTPSEPYRDLCLQAGAEVAVHDPYVVNYPNVEISDDLKEVCGKENPVIVDGKNVFNPDEFIEKGFVCKGIGRGDKNEHMIKLFLIPKDTDLQIKNWKFTRKNVDEKMSNYYMV